jgi:hypothetical protein
MVKLSNFVKPKKCFQSIKSILPLHKFMKKYLIVVFTFIVRVSFAQFAPAAGEIGSTAIYKDSSVFINWAVSCSVQRGLMNIAIPDSGYSYSGDSTMATSKAMENGVVSLGDGGIATCTFQFPISNGPGYDFAVFENSFTNNFLELAFVEVSSNGSDFFRFNSTSLTDTNTQIGPFDFIEPTQLNNLAGKYRMGYGTPFDLQELSGIDSLNINKITHVKIIDVVGSMTNNYASRDYEGRKINDPWPTQFFTGGFDLDAIGVMYQDNPQGISKIFQNNIVVFPNPSKCNQKITILSNEKINKFEIVDVSGREIFSGNETNKVEFDFLPGNYFLKIHSSQTFETHKLIIVP